MSHGTNDAEQSATGAVTLNSTDLELINDDTTGAGDQTVGLRFENIPISSGVVLATASLQFTADEVDTEPAGLFVRAQAADHAERFAPNANDLSSRPLTSSSVAWSPAPWSNIGERGPGQRTPDLSTLIDEIVARPGWRSGQAMAFLVTGTGRRTADAADKPGGTPATLAVNYWPELPVVTMRDGRRPTRLSRVQRRMTTAMAMTTFSSMPWAWIQPWLNSGSRR